MKSVMVQCSAILAAFLLNGCGPRQPKPDNQVGRFVIVHSPQIEKDTILLDTITGRTWERIEFTDLKDTPSGWDAMARMDNPGEMKQLRGQHPVLTLLPATSSAR